MAAAVSPVEVFWLGLLFLNPLSAVSVQVFEFLHLKSGKEIKKNKSDRCILNIFFNTDIGSSHNTIRMRSPCFFIMIFQYFFLINTSDNNQVIPCIMYMLIFCLFFIHQFGFDFPLFQILIINTRQ